MPEFLDDIKSFFGKGSALATEGPKPVPEQWKDDPVAQKTDWGPNEKGGINFQTHKLVESGASRLEVKATGCYQGCIGCFIFPLGILILLVGVVGLSGTASEGSDSGVGDRTFEILFAVGMLLFGLLLVISTFWFFVRLRKRLVMDRESGFLWKGGQSLVKENSSLVQTGHAKRMPLEEVWAVQLVSEFISPDAFQTYMTMSDTSRSGYDRNREMEHRTYFSYELNLVLSTGERITVMDHSDAGEVEEAGQKVAEFLKVPVWNVIGDDDYIQQCCSCYPHSPTSW